MSGTCLCQSYDFALLSLILYLHAPLVHDLLGLFGPDKLHVVGLSGRNFLVIIPLEPIEFCIEEYIEVSQGKRAALLAESRLPTLTPFSSVVLDDLDHLNLYLSNTVAPDLHLSHIATSKVSTVISYSHVRTQ